MISARLELATACVLDRRDNQLHQETLVSCRGCKREALTQCPGPDGTCCAVRAKAETLMSLRPCSHYNPAIWDN
ncbi:hypothetical protein G6F61_013814 [Rhizopus arrhizus]|nr:hypothetical protein G6F61_013814 [Rhizopus arrhizus]